MLRVTVAQLESLRNEFVGSDPTTELEIEESTGVDAYGLIVKYHPNHGDITQKLLVSNYGVVRIA